MELYIFDFLWDIYIITKDKCGLESEFTKKYWNHLLLSLNLKREAEKS